MSDLFLFSKLFPAITGMIYKSQRKCILTLSPINLSVSVVHKKNISAYLSLVNKYNGNPLQPIVIIRAHVSSPIEQLSSFFLLDGQLFLFSLAYW